jgi:UDP-3-O-[3-hydroxymyristoyl] glucosamine N-acyltransferase
MPLISAHELSKVINARVVGLDCLIHSVAPLKKANSNDIAFFYDMRFQHELDSTKAGCVVLRELPKQKIDFTALIVDSPKEAMIKVMTMLQQKQVPQGLNDAAHIDDNAELGSNVSIGPGTIIGPGVKIESGVVIGAHCVLEGDVKIGKDTVIANHNVIIGPITIGVKCVIKNHCALGGDGFGFAHTGNSWQHIPHLGSVQVGDEVMLSNHVSIDKGLMDATQIASGVKLDNHVQIGHNVILGEHVLIAGNTAVGGSTQIEKNCIIGGCCAISDHLHVTAGVTLLGGCQLASSIRHSGVYGGSFPVQEASIWRKNFAKIKKLDLLFHKNKVEI